ncbi:MAG: hypothetical protein LDL33_09485, partial [Desulfomonile sp.]|nr:hypothetical protein [Desulfomonile sp.]
TETSNSERCGNADVTPPITHLLNIYVGELIAVAKSSDRIPGLLVGVGRFRERRFDGLASPEVNGASRYPGEINRKLFLATAIYQILN